MVVFKSWSVSDHAHRPFNVSSTSDGSGWKPRFFIDPKQDRHRKVWRILLAFSFVAGFWAGMVFSSAAGELVIPWMHTAVHSRVSIRFLLCATLFPFLFSAIAVFLSQPGLLLLIAFGKAFSAGLTGMCLCAAFGDAGWLVRWLLCFSSCLSLPVLYGYWLRHIGSRAEELFCPTALLLSAAILIGSIDYFVIVPFLARVIYS